MSPEEAAKVESEIAALVEELKRHYCDPGRAGVSHVQYLMRWQGRTIESPAGDALNLQRCRRVEWDHQNKAGRLTWIVQQQPAGLDAELKKP